MAEKKINLSSQNQTNDTEANAPVSAPSTEGDAGSKQKKRGRKKKVDDTVVTETLTPPSVDENEGEFIEFPDSFSIEADEAENPLPLAEDTTEASDDAPKGDEAVSEIGEDDDEAVIDNEADEQIAIEEPTEPCADEPQENENEFLDIEHFADLYDEDTTDEKDEIVADTTSDATDDEATTDVAVEETSDAPACEEASDSLEEITANAVTDGSADNNDSGISADREEPPEAEENDTNEEREEFILPTEFALPTEDENGFLYVEHFADLYDNVEETETVDESECDATAEEDLTLDVTIEYENLTILSPEVEEEKPRPTREVREPSHDDEPYNPDKQRGVDNRFDIIELFVFTLVIIMLITTFFFKHSVVQGASMESTLFEGDHLIISDFLYTPKQYDIVVVHDPEAHAEGPMVKRVIAVGGQTVQLERELVPEESKPNKPYYVLRVSVDGVPARDDFVYYSGSDNIPIDYYFEDFEVVYKDYENGEDIYKYVVPEGEVFVMGDHRDNSKDSREFGSIKEETILGRVLIRIFPFDSFGKIEE